MGWIPKKRRSVVPSPIEIAEPHKVQPVAAVVGEDKFVEAQTGGRTESIDVKPPIPVKKLKATEN